MDLGIGVFSIEGMDAFIGNEVGKMRDKIQRGLDLSVQLFAVVCHVVQPQPWTGEVTRTVFFFFFLGGSWEVTSLWINQSRPNLNSVRKNSIYSCIQKKINYICSFSDRAIKIEPIETWPYKKKGCKNKLVMHFK